MNKMKNLLAWIGRNALANVNFVIAGAFFAQDHYLCAFGWISAGFSLMTLRYLKDSLDEAHKELLKYKLAAVTFAEMFVRAKKEMLKKEKKEGEPK